MNHHRHCILSNNDEILDVNEQGMIRYWYLNEESDEFEFDEFDKGATQACSLVYDADSGSG